eukprot:scaffold42352_cov62-Phaeocystis_antarctica.AAC.5
MGGGGWGGCMECARWAGGGLWVQETEALCESAGLAAAASAALLARLVGHAEATSVGHPRLLVHAAT